jgi:carbon-monoxide dehydrogenase large subunit
MGFEGIGASVRRREDVRFLSGKGNYTDDINRPGQFHAFIKRADRPHAKIDGIDIAAAEKAPGVVRVFTGADIAAENIGGIPCGWQIHNQDGSPMAEPMHPVLAVDKVRHVGDPVVVVIAESKQEAKNAAELIDIRYTDLPAVANLTDAVAPGAPAVHDGVAGNLCYDWVIGDKATVDGVFAKADRVVKLELTNNRLIPNAMEPRAAIGDFDPSSGDYTLYTTSQNPHVIRLLMGAFVLHIPENKLRVVAPDVGGGFGSKIYHYAE